MKLTRKERCGRSNRRVAGTPLPVLFNPVSAVPETLIRENTAGPWIQFPGNSNDDRTRSARLKEASKPTDLDEQLKSDLEKLIPEIDRWANSKRQACLSRGISRKKHWDFKIAVDSPLYPFTCLHRVRMPVWYKLESVGTSNDPKERSGFLGRAHGLLEKAENAFPENRRRVSLVSPPATHSTDQALTERSKQIVHAGSSSRLNASVR